MPSKCPVCSKKLKFTVAEDSSLVWYCPNLMCWWEPEISTPSKEREDGRSGSAVEAEIKRSS